jgi:hypothetical protein
MPRFACFAGSVVLASVVACGKPAEQPQVEKVQKNAQQLAQRAARASGNAQEVAKGFEAMGKAMAAAATSTPTRSRSIQ